VTTSNNEIKEIATISANNDTFIGDLIAEAMKVVGDDGVVKAEEAKNTETSLKTVAGMQFDRGYISPFFTTDQEKMIAELEEPAILITDMKISKMQDLLPVLEPIAQSGKPLMVICNDLDGEALQTLVVNRIRGSLNIAAVKAPGFGDLQKRTLEDIAILTGGTVISEEVGLSLEVATVDMLGHAEKIEIDKDKTTIVNGRGSSGEIEKRIALIKHQMEESSSDYDKERLKERLAKLSGGIAVLYIGAPTEAEMKEKKDRIDDALAATRAAVEEGIIPGGGVALIRSINGLEDVKCENPDEQTGVSIVERAIEEPLRQIIANSGGEGAVIVQKVKEGKADFGYNAKTETFGKLYKEGVIDPTKVTRTAIENAASIASMILTTECVIVDEPTPDAPMGMGGDINGLPPSMGL